MVRIGNSVMAAIGVAIGYLFSGNSNLLSLLLLVLAGSLALGFGNVINDIFDIETDKIAHRERALPSGDVTVPQAWIFTILLALIATGAGFVVSTAHGIATLVPILVLALYAIRLKGTPLAGNIIVSALVSYTLVYGALGGMPLIVLVPAVLAFLTNMIREIVKDLADESGDREAGLNTTATLNRSFVNRLVYTLAYLSIPAAYCAVILPQFRLIFPIGITVLLLPLQVVGIVQFRKGDYTRYASNLKKQLLLGLILIAAEGVRGVIS